MRTRSTLRASGLPLVVAALCCAWLASCVGVSVRRISTNVSSRSGDAADQAPGNPRALRKGALRVGVLCLEGVYNSELIAPIDVFDHVRFHDKPGMDVFTVGRERGWITSFEGLRIWCDYGLDEAPRIDVLVVPSAEHSMTRDLEDRRLIAWIKARGGRARYVLSVCDGAFPLAEAGLLDGVRCTTFPGDLSAFRKRYPQLDAVDDVSFVAHGRFVTGVGGAKSYDPAMFVVEAIYGKKVAEGVGRGMVIDWNLEGVAHTLVAEASMKHSAATRPKCYLPGERIDESVQVQDANGKRVSLRDILAAKACKGVLLFLVAGAEGKPGRKRGGLWCEDSFNDLPLLRHLRLDYEAKGVRFVAVCCPPVYHEEEFGYDSGAFLTKADDDAVYERNRRLFVERSLALRSDDVLPFDEIYFDPRFRLLANKKRGEASVGVRPDWQGRFKWHRDTQTYGTPTLWVLTPDGEVFGDPFTMNVYESEGRRLRYTARSVGTRLDRLVSRKTR